MMRIIRRKRPAAETRLAHPFDASRHLERSSTMARANASAMAAGKFFSVCDPQAPLLGSH
jgi:hypothetical protein